MIKRQAQSDKNEELFSSLLCSFYPVHPYDIIIFSFFEKKAHRDGYESNPHLSCKNTQHFWP